MNVGKPLEPTLICKKYTRAGLLVGKPVVFTEQDTYNIFTDLVVSSSPDLLGFSFCTIRGKFSNRQVLIIAGESGRNHHSLMDFITRGLK